MGTEPELTTVPLEELQRRLRSDPGGLTAREASRRLVELGPNEVPEKRRNPLLELLRQFWSPIPWMIEAALVLSVLVQRWADAIIIAVLLAMNGLVAFVEENQAAKAVASLRSRLSRSARVLRGGEWLSVPSREIVLGDVLRIRLGDVIPADARLLDGGPLEVDQSAVTGESLPVERHLGDVVYSGGVVARGEANLLVFATGANSFYGRTEMLVQEAGVPSHFQRAVLRIGRYLVILAVLLVVLTATVSLLRGNPAAETLEFALVVTIASIPVALPAVLSVTMAVGARQLAQRQAVVTHLPAVEELGGMDVLCCDKTGTLTENRLTVTRTWQAPGVDEDQLLLAASLASRAEDGDPIDAAVLAVAPARPAGIRVEAFTPFDPVVKRTEAEVGTRHGGTWRVSKGAPQVIAALCSDVPGTGELGQAVDAIAVRGERPLAVARWDAPGGWRTLGVLSIADPPRADSAATVAGARSLGVDVKMVTGDQVGVAAAVAEEVGLAPTMLPVDALDMEGSSDSRPGGWDDAAIEEASGFAQVFPEHKYRIVDRLQSRGHIVGMTGDGVNDAPALRQADVGIAVAGASDAARAAADVVLLTPGLSVIVRAIETAREIFARMTSYAIYRIAETLRVLFLVVVAVIAFNYFPVTPTMIVLLAILNDAAILAIAYDRVRGAARPVAWDMTTVMSVAAVLGAAGLVASFVLLAIVGAVLDLPQDVVQTMVYLKLSVAGHLTIFLTRARGPFWESPRPSATLVVAVLGTQAVATAIALSGILITAISWEQAVFVWLYAFGWFLVNDRIKLLTYRKLTSIRGAPQRGLQV